MIHDIYTAIRRMLYRWIAEGGKDEEGRRDWERRWRHAGDIKEEEVVMEE